MKNISKSFADVAAISGVDLCVREGEIHALLGENGAGKSTLVNMLAGIYHPDAGTIALNSKEVEISTPADSIAKGIGMIHQHFKLVEVMTAAENIALGSSEKSREDSNKGSEKQSHYGGSAGKFLFKKRKLIASINELSERYGLNLDPRKKVFDLSVGEKQTLEIMKVLYRGARILIMDEPTAVLTPQEISRLFSIMRSMRDDGCSIIIITHKLNEVMEISDRVTVLRQGRNVGTLTTSEVALPDLIERVVGRSVDLSIERPVYQGTTSGQPAGGGEGSETADGRTPPPNASAAPLLRLDDVTVVNADKKTALDSVSFDLAEGEILGVAGVAGSGQKELCEAIAGLRRVSGGRIYFEGKNIVGESPRAISDRGIRLGFIPEDRLGMGLVASMNLVDNMMLKDYRRYRGPLLRRGPSVERAQRLVKRLDIKTSGLSTPVSLLSGGNIQKVLLGREIDSEPRVLVTAYPVRGLDIGASYKIYDLLNEQKMKGVGIVFIGEDLDVLLELCDRILVLSHGLTTGCVDARRANKEELGFLMTGGRQQ